MLFKALQHAETRDPVRSAMDPLFMALGKRPETCLRHGVIAQHSLALETNAGGADSRTYEMKTCDTLPEPVPPSGSPPRLPAESLAAGWELELQAQMRQLENLDLRLCASWPHPETLLRFGVSRRLCILT